MARANEIRARRENAAATMASRMRNTPKAIVYDDNAENVMFRDKVLDGVVGARISTIGDKGSRIYSRDSDMGRNVAQKEATSARTHKEQLYNIKRALGMSVG